MLWNFARGTSIKQHLHELNGYMAIIVLIASFEFKWNGYKCRADKSVKKFALSIWHTLKRKRPTLEGPFFSSSRLLFRRAFAYKKAIYFPSVLFGIIYSRIKGIWVWHLLTVTVIYDKFILPCLPPYFENPWQYVTQETRDDAGVKLLPLKRFNDCEKQLKTCVMLYMYLYEAPQRRTVLFHKLLFWR